MSLPNVAYFSMEMAIDQSLHTYSGGLGFLAGSHMLSAGYLQMPMTGVTILWSYGYYDQRISHSGDVEVAYIRKYYDFLNDPNLQTEVDIFGEKVKIKAYLVKPELFGTCPVYLLTTDIDGNSDWAKSISYKLYDGNEKIRIAQEIVLGIGGVRILQQAGYKFDVIHMNEGHALPAAFELLRQYNGNLEEVKKHTVFTTHTPVAAGNEVHWVDTLMEGGYFAGASRQTAVDLGGENFSLTVAALRMSRIANAVSQLHGLVANKMWEWVKGRCPIRAITNAVNLHYWQDTRIKEAEGDLNKLLDVKKQMKAELFQYVANVAGKKFDPNILTITWARRFADYKRAWLILMDKDRIEKLLNADKLQIIFAGKFHPDDVMGKDMFNKLLHRSHTLKNVVVLPGYELQLSSMLKKGSDVWLNTPLRPFEASGTSGMSANANGAVHLSIWDGWAVEGTFTGINGYAIEYPEIDDDMSWEERHWKDHKCLMDIIENQIIPTYYDNKPEWARLMRQAIRTSEAYFNSDRMVIEYFNRLYKPIAHDGECSGTDTHELQVKEAPTFDAWTYANIK
ncbi:MAG TPA: alpha-glucan family phosphorylase [Cyanobacteria bacterium UBA11991]|nr:alpha-glucan family phosphorylase [Cyanobacteriota bacterium]MDY6358969.1 alpha-glucan family phosphorylase [Cyanobacteriota bacterium]MDY6364255.1 alpha-glucan family phosphorylase [Cyanobacteriota bacterium]MDY6382742.1 alpha-glucan family phosphorylase [Cyanobacteriota bacterium]HCB11361.1 alpha-glucan family phosphorylase [Cyanobacteria bacterium UBA11991]